MARARDIEITASIQQLTQVLTPMLPVLPIVLIAIIAEYSISPMTLTRFQQLRQQGIIDFSDIIFEDNLNFSQIVGDLAGINFVHSTLRGARFRNLTKIDFRRATLDGARFEDLRVIDFRGAILNNAQFEEYSILRRVNFDRADLSHARFNSTSFRNVVQGVLQCGVSFLNAILIDTTFDRCYLAGVPFDWANLTDAKFLHCYLQDQIDSTEQYIEETDATVDRELQPASFRNVTVTRTHFINVQWKERDEEGGLMDKPTGNAIFDNLQGIAAEWDQGEDGDVQPENLLTAQGQQPEPHQEADDDDNHGDDNNGEGDNNDDENNGLSAGQPHQESDEQKGSEKTDNDNPNREEDNQKQEEQDKDIVKSGDDQEQEQEKQGKQGKKEESASSTAQRRSPSSRPLAILNGDDDGEEEEDKNDNESVYISGDFIDIIDIRNEEAGDENEEQEGEEEQAKTEESELSAAERKSPLPIPSPTLASNSRMFRPSESVSREGDSLKTLKHQVISLAEAFIESTSPFQSKMQRGAFVGQHNRPYRDLLMSFERYKKSSDHSKEAVEDLLKCVEKFQKQGQLVKKIRQYRDAVNVAKKQSRLISMRIS